MDKIFYFFLGTTAELIRIAPVIKELKKRKIKYKLIFSGQTKIKIDEIKDYVGPIKPTIIFNEKSNKYSTLLFMFWAIRTFFKGLYVLGKEFKHCGQQPDYVKRLFRKSGFKFWSGDLHEEPNYIYDGEITVGNGKTIGYMRNPLIHIKHKNLSEMVEKTNGWSEIEARLMFEAKHPPMNVLRFVSAMFREFWLRMIKQAAFLDGPEGIIYALYQVFSRFVSYAKLWELQLNKSNIKYQKE